MSEELPITELEVEYPEHKAGFATSEFWLTLANTIMMVLVAFGVVGQPDADDIMGLLGPLVGAVIPIIMYIWSRTRVKGG